MAEVLARISKTTAAYAVLRKTSRSTMISADTKIRIFKPNVLGAPNLGKKVSKVNSNKIDTFQIRCLCRILRIF